MPKSVTEAQLRSLVIAITIWSGQAWTQLNPGVIEVSNSDLRKLDQVFERTPQGLTSFSRDLSPVVRALSLATNQGAEQELSLKRAVGECQEALQDQRPVVLPLLQRTPSRWSFTIESNFSAPRGTFSKEFLTQRTPALRQGLEQLIAQRFDDHAERLSAITEFCRGRAEAEILQLGALLGGRLAQSYDHARAAGVADQSFVSPQDQWEALRSGAASGVCRDSALTIAQFLNACGVSFDRMKIEGYRSVSGGHQVVTIRGRDGRPYTINWSELYAQDDSVGVAAAPAPSIVNTDIFYRSYDPQTGRLLEERRTELGEVLATVTGGRRNEAAYLPDLLRLEASNGTISANLFMTQTQRGDFARGASVYYQNANTETFRAHVGMALAVNEREVLVTPARGKERLEQTLYYLNLGAEWEPVIPLAQRSGVSIEGRPLVGMESEVYMSRNSLQGRGSEQNMNLITTAYVGGQVAIEMGRGSLSFGGRQLVSVTRRPYNTEQPDGGPVVGIIPTGVQWNATAQYGAGPIIYTVGIERITSYQETYQALDLSVTDRANRYRLGVLVASYDRDRLGTETWVGARGDARMCLGSVGGRAGGEVSTTPDLRNFNVGMTLTLSGPCAGN